MVTDRPRASLALVVLGASFALAGCDSEGEAMKKAAAAGTSCPPDKVEVRDSTSHYRGRLQTNYAVYDVNVCGGGWRTFCLERGVNRASEGLDVCLKE
jgi:hypothetical protein